MKSTSSSRRENKCEISQYIQRKGVNVNKHVESKCGIIKFLKWMDKCGGL